MEVMATRDFASLLDDLIAAEAETKTSAPTPSVPFDYLTVADELHSGRINVSKDAVEAEYRSAGDDQDVDRHFVARSTVSPLDLAVVAAEPLLPVEPEKIAAELGLANAHVGDFARIRRSFAFANHPDRVAPHLRQRAMVRMQVANMLIDDAQQRVGRPPASVVFEALCILIEIRANTRQACPLEESRNSAVLRRLQARLAFAAPI